MMKKLLSLCALGLCLPLTAYGQGYVGRQPMAAVSSQAAPSTVEENTDDQSVLPPVDITEEQKLKAQESLKKNQELLSKNAEEQERKALLDAIATVDKIRIRKLNRSLPPEKQIKYSREKVNYKNRDEVERFLNEKFVEPVNEVFKYQEENTETLDTEKPLQE